MRDFAAPPKRQTGETADWATMRRFVPHQWPAGRPDLKRRIMLAGVLVLISAVVLTRYFGRIPSLTGFALDPPVPAESSSTGTATAAGGIGGFGISVGDLGRSASPLRPAGRARFGERYLDVVADGSFVDPDRAIQVIQVSGNRIVVRELETS